MGTYKCNNYNVLGSGFCLQMPKGHCNQSPHLHRSPVPRKYVVRSYCSLSLCPLPYIL